MASAPPPSAAPAPRGREGTRARAEALAARLGLPSAAAAALPDQWAHQPSAAETALADGLAARLATRVTQATEPDRLHTALGWLHRFQVALPSRVFLLPRGGADDITAAAYNAQSFAKLAEFIRAHGSVKVGSGGKRVSSGAIEGYISCLKTHLSVVLNRKLVSSEADLQRPRQAKHMRLEDPARGARSRRVGVRARHLRAAAPNFDRSSRLGFLRWTIALTALSCLLRGGEVGRVNAKPFDPDRGLTWQLYDSDTRVGTFEWLSPEMLQQPYFAVCLWVVPVKDGAGTQPRYPILIRALEPGPPDDAAPIDPMCLYSHLRRIWLTERHLHAPTDAFFALPTQNGRSARACSTTDVARVAHDVMAAAGESTDDLGGHVFRIGGATDLRDALGVERGRATITDRGRWADDDLNVIYQRITVDEQLHASAAMMSASRVDIERVFSGWAQPARRRR